MSIRERLFEISELNIAQKLIQMRDAELDEYIAALNRFTEEFPSWEAELKGALEMRDYLSFSKCLVVIREALILIYADELAEECLKQINGLVAVKHEKIEAYMTYLLSLLSMLSIDIQMAIYKDENDEESAAIDSPAGEPDSGKKSVLAVDDNTFFLDSLKKALLDTDYRFIGVNSGASALGFLEGHSPDLFILDIEMPEMDGYELARNIRKRGEKAPILFLTGNATKDYVLKALKAGAADFIVKPVTQRQVLERINKFI